MKALRTAYKAYSFLLLLAGIGCIDVIVTQVGKGFVVIKRLTTVRICLARTMELAIMR